MALTPKEKRAAMSSTFYSGSRWAPGVKSWAGLDPSEIRDG
jgi:hypothetical protein